MNIRNVPYGRYIFQVVKSWTNICHGIDGGGGGGDDDGRRGAACLGSAN